MGANRAAHTCPSGWSTSASTNALFSVSLSSVMPSPCSGWLNINRVLVQSRTLLCGGGRRCQGCRQLRATILYVAAAAAATNFRQLSR